MSTTTIPPIVVSWLATAIVGLAFISTGIIKAIAPNTFRRHLALLGWIPGSLLSTAVTVAAAFEVAWGMSLAVNLLPRLLIPFSVILLGVLSAISWWGVKSGKASDCGCYGGFIQPSILQSLSLNALFAALLIVAWTLGPNRAAPADWQISLVVAATVSAALVTEWARRWERKSGMPKFARSPLRAGAVWRESWAHGAAKDIPGEVLIAFLGPDCPYCKQWIKVGNAMVESDRLPKVVGVVGVSEKRRDDFVSEFGIHFPVATVSPSAMNRLAQAVPTIVLVEDSKIRDVWVGQMAPEFVERFRRAFFSDAAVEAARQGGSLTASS